MYNTRIMSKIRKNNPRRVFRNRMAGYVSSHNKHRSGMSLLCALAVLLSIVLLSACPGERIIERIVDREVIPPTEVTDITIADITATSLTLNWTNPTDSDGFKGVLISTYSVGGTLAIPQQQPTNATTATIADINPLTTYFFTLTSVYTNSSKNDISAVQIARTLSRATLPIDANNNGLVDITSLERLDSIRYNLDLIDGIYKSSAEDEGVQCGTAQDTDCTGYELVISLDFANPNHYEGGEVNAAWRPQDSSGTVIAQADAATNSGWDPIGTATSGNRFNSRVEGNGYTISNLYGRLTSGGNLGLFGATGSNSVIRSVGVATARLYGSDGMDNIGALAGINDGTIIASYANGTINGGTNTDNIGVLVGQSAGSTIIASYASGMLNGGAGHDTVGGLVGQQTGNDSTIIASYASGTVNGGADDTDNVGGLAGHTFGGTIMASYASGSANGGAGNDNVGGLEGSFIGINFIASYATATADGGADDDTVGSIGVNAGTGIFIATYGFGTATGENAGLDNSDPRPAGVAAVGSGIDGARMLTLDTAGEQWNQAVITDSPTTTITTMDAWDFGTNTQAPALRYADYDGAADTYGCGNDSMADIVIPSVVATPTGPMTITCGTTLLPEQER